MKKNYINPAPFNIKYKQKINNNNKYNKDNLNEKTFEDFLVLFENYKKLIEETSKEITLAEELTFELRKKKIEENSFKNKNIKLSLFKNNNKNNQNSKQNQNIKQNLYLKKKRSHSANEKKEILNRNKPTSNRSKNKKEIIKFEVDIDEMSYEEILALEEKIGNVGKGIKMDEFEFIPDLIFDEKYDDQECSICLKEFEIGEKLKELFCHHIYHEECISKWFLEEKTCPYCKQYVFD